MRSSATQKAIWTEFSIDMDAEGFLDWIGNPGLASIVFVELDSDEFPDRSSIPPSLVGHAMRHPSFKLVWRGDATRKLVEQSGLRVLDAEFSDPIEAEPDDVPEANKIENLKIVPGSKHDAILIWTRSGVHSNAQTYGDRLEVEYVIGSLRKFCSSWLNRIILVGDRPDRELDVDVFIEVGNIYKTTKAANIWNKIREGIVQVPDLSEDFMFVSDDQIVVKETRWEDVVLMYSRIVSPEMLDLDIETYIQKNMKPNIVDVEWERIWHKISYTTFRKFYDGKHGVKQFEPHVWMKFNKFRFLQMCDMYDYVNDIGCLTETTYYNTFNDGKSEKIKDHVYVGVNKSREYILKISRIKWIEQSKIRWLCWTDYAFSFSEFRNVLKNITSIE